MATARVARLAFNRGLVSRLGLARADIARLAMAAETMINWVPRVLGSMMLRPGMQFLSSSKGDSQAFYLPFVFSISDKAKVELTNAALRVWVSDAVIARTAVASAVTNGAFGANLSGWTNADEAGATSAWESGGYMGLTGNGAAFAIRQQTIAIAAGDQNVEHGLHIIIERGPVVFRAGTTLGDDDLINETSLGRGAHSLAVTPTGASLFLEFKSRLLRIVLVDSVAVEAAGDMVVEAPWATADLQKVRHDQSGDIFFVAADGYQQRRIERRATRSWSVVRYEPEDGPFLPINVSKTTIAASAITGNVTLTASKPLFRSGHVDALFQIISAGQTVQVNAVENTFTGTIRVTGVGTARGFTVSRTGTWVATVTLQRSFDEAVSWIDVTTYTGNGSVVYNDGLDNQDILYRIGIKTGDFTSGTAALTLAITTGSITGVVRVLTYSTNVSVTAEVITALGGTAATEDWAEGSWSTVRGFPTAVAFHEGRLSWAGRDKFNLSISDAFDGFDPDYLGDAAPISRSIGSGPVDTINWLLSMQRLLAGADMAEFSVRSSSLDEPLTPTNFNLKAASTQGSAAVAAVKVDQSGFFVQQGGVRVYELAWGQTGVDYESSQLSALVPEIGLPQITKIAVQRKPDTRLHCMRSDGTVAMLVFDKLENVVAWLDITTDGLVEDIVVLPGDAGDREDFVYYSINRTIDGATKRYLEKWAFESDVGDLVQNKQADSFIAYNQAASSTISGLTHLEAKAVIVWDNGKCLRDANGDIVTFTVSGGSITVTNAGAVYQATIGVVGLPFTGSWKSAKLVELMLDASGALTDSQMLKGLALILADVHAKGLKYGPSLVESEMNALPATSPTGAAVGVDEVRKDYVMENIAFPGGWTHDSRLCLLAKAPRPCTVLAALAELKYYG